MYLKKGKYLQVYKTKVLLGEAAFCGGNRVNLVFTIREVIEVGLVDLVLHPSITVVIEHRANRAIDGQLRVELDLKSKDSHACRLPVPSLHPAD